MALIYSSKLGNWCDQFSQGGKNEYLKHIECLLEFASLCPASGDGVGSRVVSIERTWIPHPSWCPPAELWDLGICYDAGKNRRLGGPEGSHTQMLKRMGERWGSDSQTSEPLSAGIHKCSWLQADRPSRWSHLASVATSALKCRNDCPKQTSKYQMLT